MKFGDNKNVYTRSKVNETFGVKSVEFFSFFSDLLDTLLYINESC